MNDSNLNDDELLVRYLTNNLDADARREFEMSISEDSSLAAKVSVFQSLVGKYREDSVDEGFEESYETDVLSNQVAVTNEALQGADLNLLFGVMAMQLGFIDSDQFAQACGVWATHKSSLLAGILEERGWLTKIERRALEILVQKKLERNDGDVLQTLSSVADAGSRDVIRSINDDDIHQTLGCIRPGPGFVQIHKVDIHTDERSHYTLTRVHGQGGLGRVWLARDKYLNREVALKEIRPDLDVEDSEVQRFVKEAQITGQLDHPNIIPIYELARDSSEKPPFYTMRFMRGQTLRDAIREYHRRRAHGETETLELRRLLNAFVGMCNALAYAHSKGVIHRDLKPANVMLGAFGEVVVLDWGLAKMVDQPEDETLVFPQIKVSDGGDASRTELGQALGTPAFMAPEQAEGRLADVDSRSDVYGLGATLFNLLTNATPHKGKTTVETLRMIVEDATPHPRDVDPSVPKPLDAICTKAMAKNSQARYQSSTELAEDVQRWLADEPVKAYDEPMPERVGRWVRHNRSWSLAIAASLLVITIASTTAMVFVDRARQVAVDARRDAESARDNERKSKELATRWLRDARETVDTFTTNFSRELTPIEGTNSLRINLLTRAAESYRRFAEEEADDAELQAESGWAYLRLGDVYQLLGEFEKSHQAYIDAESLLSKFATSAPSNQKLQLELARTRSKLGIALANLEKPKDSEATFDKCIADLDKLIEQSEDSAEAIALKAECFVIRARLLLFARKLDDAEKMLLAAAADLKDVVERDSNVRYRQWYARTLSALGQLHAFTGRNDEAVIQLGAAIRHFDDLSVLFPLDLEYAEGGAVGRIDLANACQVLGRVNQERDAYEQAIVVYDRIVQQRSDIPHFRFVRAVASTSLSRLFAELGENKLAEQQCRLALDAYRFLIAKSPSHFQYHEGNAQSHATLGSVLLNLGRYDDAIESFDQASEIYSKELLARYPDEPAYLRGLAATQVNLARTQQAQFTASGDDKWLTSAEQLLRQGLENYSTAATHWDGEGVDPFSQDGSAWAHMYLGDLLVETMKPDDARSEYETAKRLWSEIATTPEYASNLCSLLTNCRDEAIRDPATSIELASQLTKAVSDNPKYWLNLGMAHYRNDEWEKCVSVIGEAKSRRRSDDAFDLFLLAMANKRLGKSSEAKECLSEAMDSTFAAENTGRATLTRLRAEAERLLSDATNGEE